MHKFINMISIKCLNLAAQKFYSWKFVCVCVCASPILSHPEHFHMHAFSSEDAVMAHFNETRPQRVSSNWTFSVVAFYFCRLEWWINQLRDSSNWEILKSNLHVFCDLCPEWNYSTFFTASGSFRFILLLLISQASVCFPTKVCFIWPWILKNYQHNFGIIKAT